MIVNVYWVGRVGGQVPRKMGKWKRRISMLLW